MLKGIIILIVLIYYISPSYAANTESDEFVYNGIMLSGGCRVITESSENEEIKTKFGIAGNFDSETKKLAVYDESGEIKSYTFNDNIINGAVLSLLSEELSADNMPKRVIEYRALEDEGRITDIMLAECKQNSGYELYNEKTNSVGNIVMGKDTKVVDAIDFYEYSKEPSLKDLIMTTTDGFVDDAECKVYAYGATDKFGAYPYVIVAFSGSRDIFEEGFAVVAKTPESIEGDLGYALSVYYGGKKYLQENALMVNVDATVYGKDDITSLAKGDVITYLCDNTGQIKHIDVLLSAEETGIDSDYQQVLKNAFSGNVIPDIPTDAINWINTWTVDDAPDAINPEQSITRILYGLILKVDTGISFKLGSVGIADNEEIYTPGNGKAVLYSGCFTDLSKKGGAGVSVDVEIDDSTNVYIFDFSKIKIGTTGDINSSLNTAYYCNDGNYIAWDGFFDEINGEIKTGDIGYPSFAMVKLDDEYATDVFVILAE